MCPKSNARFDPDRKQSEIKAYKKANNELYTIR